MGFSVTNFASIALIILFGFTVEAQKKHRGKIIEQPDAIECYALAEYLGVPQKTKFSAGSSAFTKQAVYKIYLSSRLDFWLETTLEKWIQRWNENKGKKYAELAIVKELNKADIVLIRFQDPTETVEETVISEPIISGQIRQGTIRSTNIFSPVRSYILLPKADGFEIVWRHKKLLPRDTPSNRIGFAGFENALTAQLKKH